MRESNGKEKTGRDGVLIFGNEINRSGAKPLFVYIVMRRLLCLVVAVPLLIVSPASGQERIREEVTVDWWVMPLFALDKRGGPVTDLRKEEIELLVNKKRIDDFIFFKREFTYSRPKRTRPEQAGEAPVLEREKTIIFLFDTALSDRGTITREKAVAQEIVLNTRHDHRFIIMTIDPTKGLQYLAGPLTNKNHIQGIIEERVDIHRSSGAFSFKEELRQLGQLGQSGGKYTAEELERFLVPHLAGAQLLKNRNFIDSFENLYYTIFYLQGNKFIYLFSEGISRDTEILKARLMPDNPTFYPKLSQVAGFLSRSGCVLFIINPSILTNDDFIYGSGEDSLRFLAKESGGKYLDGTKKEIVKRIENVHSAYYEIAFSDPAAEAQTRQITLEPKRRGIQIHTLRTLEKRKGYAQMKEIEKEILVLNLIRGNPLARSILSSIQLESDSTLRDNQNIIIYRVTIPDDFLNKRVELFKIWIDGDSGASTVEKENATFTSNKAEIVFENRENHDTHFVIVYPQMNFALVKK